MWSTLRPDTCLVFFVVVCVCGHCPSVLSCLWAFQVDALPALGCAASPFCFYLVPLSRIPPGPGASFNACEGGPNLCAALCGCGARVPCVLCVLLCACLRALLCVALLLRACACVACSRACLCACACVACLRACVCVLALCSRPRVRCAFAPACACAAPRPLPAPGVPARPRASSRGRTLRSPILIPRLVYARFCSVFSCPFCSFQFVASCEAPDTSPRGHLDGVLR